jgi:prepilin-type N-terminal cleavage/methylation domain-containing protein
MRRKGFTLIEILIAIAIIAILAAIAVSNLLSAQRKSKYARAASDTKTAVSQTIVYQNDRNLYPGTLAALRENGYANVEDNDPWKNPYVTSNLFKDTSSTPSAGYEIHVCSLGVTSTAPDCTSADLVGTPVSVPNGGVGYSGTYGGWQGW